jgi:hypothetical protein
LFWALPDPLFFLRAWVNVVHFNDDCYPRVQESEMSQKLKSQGKDRSKTLHLSWSRAQWRRGPKVVGGSEIDRIAQCIKGICKIREPVGWL